MKIQHRRGVDQTRDGILGEITLGLVLGIPGDGMSGTSEAHNNISKEKKMHGKETGESKDTYNSYTSGCSVGMMDIELVAVVDPRQRPLRGVDAKRML